MKRHIIDKPKNYKRYQQPDRSEIKGMDYGIYLEYESFIRRWDMLKEQEIAYKVCREIGIAASTIRETIRRFKANQQTYNDRKRIEKFINSVEV